MCSSILAMKRSNMTDFKWKSGNLVSLSCTVIMSNFHCGNLGGGTVINGRRRGREEKERGKEEREGEFKGEERRCAVGIFNYFRPCRELIEK